MQINNYFLQLLIQKPAYWEWFLILAFSISIFNLVTYCNALNKLKDCGNSLMNFAESENLEDVFDAGKQLRKSASKLLLVFWLNILLGIIAIIILLNIKI